MAKKHNPFEAIFHEFVADFGGEVLPEAAQGYTADYYFRKQDVVAELKCLTVDQSKDINSKLTPLVVEWIKKTGRRPPGVVEADKYMVLMKDMPPEIANAWIKWLKVPLDGLIRDANRQIRDTKKRFKLNSAKGMVLIANQANLHHDHPDSYRRLIADILCKRTSDGDLRYSHIHGGVYFSTKDVKSRVEKMYFWANLQMRRSPDDNVEPLAKFQAELQHAWYQYVADKCQLVVRKFSRTPSETDGGELQISAQFTPCT